MSELIYLDNGATSFPKPEEVYSYMDQFYRQYGVNPGRAGYDICLEAGAIVESTRQQLTDLFNGNDPDRLCFTYNSTDSLNIIINGILRPGDHAITTTLEHNSVLRPLYHLSLEGVQVDYVSFNNAGFIDPDDIRKRFRSNTRLVIVNHASNVIGTIQPIREIGYFCRQAGIPFAIDASQSAGKVPIDVQEQHIDLVAFTGHKSLLGPTGIGGLYVGEGIEIRPTRVGGTGVRSAERMHPEEYPYRLEAGTLNTLGIAGLHAGVQWLQSKGMDNLHGQEMELTRMLRDQIANLPGTILYCQEDLNDHIAVLSFNLEGVEASDIGEMLNLEHHLACRTGLHCAPLLHQQLGTAKIGGAVRFSLGPFTTQDHILQTKNALQETVSFFS